MKYLILSLVIISSPLQAKVPNYYINLSNKTNVPVDVLFALASNETNTELSNGKVLPWPYAINLNGIGENFSTSDAMLSRANELLQQGVIHFDCGLFQVNWKWNGRHRANGIAEACNPKSNGIIAATIIKEYYSKTGDWIESAGKYHNPSNANGAADRYKKGFIKKLERARRMINGQ